MIANDVIELEPQTLLEDDEVAFAITLEGVTTISNGTEQMFVFRQSTDLTSTFTTGSMSNTDGPPAILTTKTFQNLKAGDTLTVTVYATMDGQKQGRQFKIFVRGNSGKM